MRKKFTHLTGALLLSVFCLTGFAQNYPFPQNVTYTYGRMPSNANHANALAAYNSWKTDYVVSAPCAGGGALRVKFDSPQDNNTVSEGIAYGMLLAAYAGDKPTFDGLWQFYDANKNGNGVMNWKVSSSCGIVGANGASDAELDVAMAFYVADWQWPGNGYMTECQTMVSTIRIREVDQGSSGHGRYTLRPGDQFGGHGSGSCGSGSCDDLTNPSYFSPAYYRVFANWVEPGQAAFWNKLADDGYALINLAKNNSTGLVPDWVRGSNGNTNPGVAGGLGYQYNGERFFFDAIRTPFRSAVDYLWFGTPEAKTYCELVSDWVITQNGSAGTNNMGSGYYIDGTQFNSDHSNTFVGCFGVSAMATDRTGTYQTHINNAYTDNNNTPPPGGQYFNATLKALTLFIQTGNFYLPPPDACKTPDLGPDVSLCSGSPQNLNSQLSGGSITYEWKRNGSTIGGATSSTYNATQPGVYEVISDSAGCVRRDVIEVFDVNPTADFTFQIVGTTVNFSNNSTNGVTQWSWDVDNGGSTVDYTTSDPSHPYAAAGVYDVTLTVQNTCANSDQITKQVAIGNPGSAGGWVENDFGNWLTSAPWSAGPANVVTTNCSEVMGASTNPGQFTGWGITFKDGGADDPQDLSNYPYVIMKIKTSNAIQLRVDLGDATTNCGGFGCTTSQTPTHIDLTSNVGDYQIVTLDFTGKFTHWDATPMADDQISQIQFYPGDAPGGTPQSFTGTITIDWIIAGFANLPPPTPVVADAIACTGNTVALDATDCHAETYIWSTGENTASINAGPGTYWVDATNFGGTTRDSVVVTELQDPAAGFAFVTTGLDVDFTNGSTNGTTYLWDFDDAAATSSATNPSHTFTGSGTYNVCLTATNSCDNNQFCQDVTVSNPAGVGTSSTDFVSVSPNPSSGVFNIKVEGSASVTVANALGNTLYDAEVSGYSKVDLSGAAAGIYILKAESAGKTETIRLVVE